MSAQVSVPYNDFEKYTFKITATSSRGQWVNSLRPSDAYMRRWTNAGILLIGTLGTNFSEILIDIQTFSFKKMHLKISSVKWHPFCLVLNVLRTPAALAMTCCFIWLIPDTCSDYHYMTSFKSQQSVSLWACGCHISEGQTCTSLLQDAHKQVAHGQKMGTIYQSLEITYLQHSYMYLTHWSLVNVVSFDTSDWRNFP